MGRVEAHELASSNPRWAVIAATWAASEPAIERLWFYGSRVSGLRGAHKELNRCTSDLDVAFTLSAPPGEALAIAIFRQQEWEQTLSEAMGIAVDLQFADPEDVVVWPAVKACGVLVYERSYR